MQTQSAFPSSQVTKRTIANVFLDTWELDKCAEVKTKTISFGIVLKTFWLMNVKLLSTLNSAWILNLQPNPDQEVVGSNPTRIFFNFRAALQKHSWLQLLNII